MVQIQSDEVEIQSVVIQIQSVMVQIQNQFDAFTSICFPFPHSLNGLLDSNHRPSDREAHTLPLSRCIYLPLVPSICPPLQNRADRPGGPHRELTLWGVCSVLYGQITSLYRRCPGNHGHRLPMATATTDDSPPTSGELLVPGVWAETLVIGSEPAEVTWWKPCWHGYTLLSLPTSTSALYHIHVVPNKV